MIQVHIIVQCGIGPLYIILCALPIHLSFPSVQSFTIFKDSPFAEYLLVGSTWHIVVDIGFCGQYQSFKSHHTFPWHGTHLILDWIILHLLNEPHIERPLSDCHILASINISYYKYLCEFWHIFQFAWTRYRVYCFILA